MIKSVPQLLKQLNQPDVALHQGVDKRWTLSVGNRVLRTNITALERTTLKTWETLIDQLRRI